jgi:pilus assembly protein CpaC
MHRTVRATPFPRQGLRGGSAAKRASLPAFRLLTLALFLALPFSAHAQVCTPESRPVVVTIGGSVRLQMNSRKPIKTVTNPKDNLLQIRTVERDPTTVVLSGDRPGITRLELEDVDGNREIREVQIQVDVEYLAAQLRRAVPLGNIQVTPNGPAGVILTGFVTRPEDIQVASQIAVNLGLLPVSNLRVAGNHQVQLDVVVAQVDRSKGRNFGFNFLQNSPNEILGSTVGNLIPTVGNVGVPSSVLSPTFAGQNIASAPGQANIFSGVIFPKSGFLGFLQALEQENLAKLLAKPTLVTLSGNPASFLSGGEQAVPVPAGLGQVGVQFEEFGTRLNFLPIILGNGKIHLEVEPEVSSLNANAGVSIAGATVAGRSTQRIHTTVELESGQTFVIGGLIQHTVSSGTNKIPLLGQIPFLGVAFSTKQFVEDEQELIVLVTPHLVDAQSCNQVAKVLPGQESRTPDDFELYLEGILEAPRGPREVFQGKRYVPAHLNGPLADLFPCAGRTAVGGGPAAPGGPGGPVAPQAAMAAPATVGSAPMPVQSQPVSTEGTTPTSMNLAPQSGPPAAAAPTGGALMAETPASPERVAMPAAAPPGAMPAVPGKPAETPVSSPSSLPLPTGDRP